MRLNIADLKRRLEAKPERMGPASMRDAAVLVPLVKQNSEWALVFTKRSAELSRHSGEISFPGGRLDEGENAREAAIRETSEELGVQADRVEVLGALPTTLTVISGYEVSPWVGILDDANFTPNPAEIAEVFVASLSDLLKEGTRREQTFIRGGGVFTNPAYDLGGHTIWGATARILTDMLDLLQKPAASA